MFPKFTADAVVNPVPKTITTVPPPLPPVIGLIPVTVGVPG